MKKYFLLLITVLSIVFNLNAQVKDETYYFNIAKTELEKSGPSRSIKDNISHAIELNPKNAEYRWVRVRCNMLTSSGEDEFLQAEEDLNKMIDLGEKSGKIYGYLGLVYKQLGNIYNYEKRAKKNESFSDDDSAYLKEQKDINAKAIFYYKKAIDGYNKAIEINPEKFKENLKYEEPQLLNKITDVEEKTNKLK